MTELERALALSKYPGWAFGPCRDCGTKTSYRVEDGPIWAICLRCQRG